MHQIWEREIREKIRKAGERLESAGVQLKPFPPVYISAPYIFPPTKQVHRLIAVSVRELVDSPEGDVVATFLQREKAPLIGRQMTEGKKRFEFGFNSEGAYRKTFVKEREKPGNRYAWKETEYERISIEEFAGNLIYPQEFLGALRQFIERKIKEVAEEI